MSKYSSETKNQALKMMEREGVTKTCNAMKITKATLYKWRNEGTKESTPAAQPKRTITKAKKAPLVAPVDAKEAARALLTEGDDLADKVRLLEAENAKLRDRNQKLKAALEALLQ